VSSGDEIAVFIDEESRSVNELHRELTSGIELPTKNGDHRVLHALNGQDETIGTIPRQTKQAPKKREQKQDAKDTNKSHTSGVLSIANDGKAIGCDVSDKPSSTVYVLCPQIDSVGARKEARPLTIRDPQAQPPSQE
jgi:hypothetical protein